MSKILCGVRVLDLTRLLAGPYATRILADFGAEVIKIQSKKTASGAESNTSTYFNSWNRNKLSIALNMSYPKARELFFKLVAISDIVIENFTPRVMENWGLGYEKLTSVNPDLIMASMSGMGQTGPWRNYVAFGPTIQALSGLTYLTSFNEDAPLGPGYPYGDIVAGLYAVIAILAALEYRDREGIGQHIDLSEYEALCSLMGPTFLDILVNQKQVLPQGNKPDYISAAPYGCYKCSGPDRWCVIAVFKEAEWQALCRAMGDPEWTQQEKFSVSSNRKKHGAELDKLVEQWTITQEAENLMSLLQGAGVPAGVVHNAGDLANDPHLQARDYFVRLEHPVLGTTISDASPIRFINSKPEPFKAAPLLGKDNRYVYMNLLGLEETELASYVERGIIG